MSTAETADLLVEIGTEELPPGALKPMMLAFAGGLVEALAAERLDCGEMRPYASPRRLAVRIDAVARRQADREIEQKGPPVAVAFDDDGMPTRAAEAFAKKCGVRVDELEREQSDKGEWLCFRGSEPGREAADIIPGCVRLALDKLPIPRRMRWGAGATEFVRPVHWVVMLHGDAVVPGQVFGLAAGRVSHGHRFMGDGRVELASAGDYPGKLEAGGRVIADFGERRARIVAAVEKAATEAGGSPVANDELYDEVTALTEWPAAITGEFEEVYLELPPEVIVATLTGHQRYFPIAAADGRLLPRFVTVANLDSPEPDKVRDGNERVIRPRLADAAFFWNADRARPLAGRCDDLADVVYQRGLGTLADRSRRIALLGASLAADVDTDPLLVERAALLGKCDLLTGMVGEFPELQGTMGRYYARAAGEPAAVADAIGEQYLPRFAGDELPQTPAGRVLAIADKLDALCGIFAAGKKPSGNRDPFGLRRAALGVVRIGIECGVDFDLPAAIAAGLMLQPVPAPEAAAEELYDFIVERLRGWYQEKGDISTEMFEAVRAREPRSLIDFDARLEAVAGFVTNEAAESLAAANKRIANILRQAGFDDDGAPDAALFDSDAERELHDALGRAAEAVEGMLERRRYGDVLAKLAGLRAAVDRFFDDVMVMADDDDLRRNRLKLLSGLRAEFLKVADISRLSIARS